MLADGADAQPDGLGQSAEDAELVQLEGGTLRDAGPLSLKKSPQAHQQDDAQNQDSDRNPEMHIGEDGNQPGSPHPPTSSRRTGRCSP